MINLRPILRALRRVLIWFFCAYWVMFIGYTIKNLLIGGPRAVVVWYRHISGGAFRWDWRVFMAEQLAIFAITLILYFFGQRSSRREIRKSGGNP